jgi:hypothetical protein
VAPLLNLLSLNTGFGAAEALTSGLAGAADLGTYKTACWGAVMLASLASICAALELALTLKAGPSLPPSSLSGASVRAYPGRLLIVPALVFGPVQVIGGDVGRLVLSALLAAAWTACCRIPGQLECRIRRTRAKPLSAAPVLRAAQSHQSRTAQRAERPCLFRYAA